MKKNLGILVGAAALLLAGEFSQAQPSRGGRNRIMPPQPIRKPARMPSRASRPIHIDMYGTHLRGQNTVRLKQEIRNMYPGMNLQNAQIRSVTMIAKTKGGRGTAHLKVGQNESYPQTVYGHPNDFHRPGRRTFSQVYMSNPSFDSQGVWQIKLRGNFKIDSIKVDLVQPRRGRNKLVLEMYNEHLRGQNSIGIKRLIRQQYGDVGLRNKVIKKVVLFAKSKKGRGGASLDVGGSSSYEEVIPGSPYSFHDSSKHTYYRVVLHNPSYNSNGRVRVNLRGNIKIDKIVVKFQNSRRY